MSYPIQRPTFQPAMRLVVAITQTNPAAVTTSFPHNYVNGTILRMYSYPANGMMQINGLTGDIIVTGPTTFTIDIDAIQMDPFHVPVGPTADNSEACCVPIGELNSQLTAAVVNVLTPP